MKIQANIFNYNNTNITFRNQMGEVFVNATEMAKPFKTKPSDWLRTEPAQKMIHAITTSHICEVTELVKTINGGNERGTWMHEDVALVFAQWLSPEFYIWCNNHIKQLIKQGYTQLDSLTTEQLLQLLASRLQLGTIIQPANNVQPTQYHPINLKGWQWEGNKRLEYVYSHLLANGCKTAQITRGVELQRGQILLTLRKLSTDLNISYRALRTVLAKLVASNEVVNLSKERSYTLLEIVNFNKYVGVC